MPDKQPQCRAEPMMPMIPRASGIGENQPCVKSVTEAEHLNRRLDQAHDSLMKVKRVKDDKELEVCSLEGHKDRVKSIDADLQVIIHDMLFIGDYKRLQKEQLAWKKLHSRFE